MLGVVLVPCCPPVGPLGPLSSPTAFGSMVDVITSLSALLFLNCGLQKLISAIYADYARSLKNLGFKQGAVLFASKAGAAGRDLLNELESPRQEQTEEWRVSTCREPGLASGTGAGLAVRAVTVQTAEDADVPGSLWAAHRFSKAACAQRQVSVSVVKSKFHVLCLSQKKRQMLQILKGYTILYFWRQLEESLEILLIFLKLQVTESFFSLTKRKDIWKI